MGCMCFSRYCPQCKNDDSEVVRAGEKLKMSKKKSKMASASSTAKRDWGRVQLSFIKLITKYEMYVSYLTYEGSVCKFLS